MLGKAHKRLWATPLRPALTPALGLESRNLLLPFLLRKKRLRADQGLTDPESGREFWTAPGQEAWWCASAVLPPREAR